MDEPFEHEDFMDTNVDNEHFDDTDKIEVKPWTEGIPIKDGTVGIQVGMSWEKAGQLLEKLKFW